MPETNLDSSRNTSTPTAEARAGIISEIGIDIDGNFMSPKVAHLMGDYALRILNDRYLIDQGIIAAPDNGFGHAHLLINKIFSDMTNDAIDMFSKDSSIDPDSYDFHSLNYISSLKELSSNTRVAVEYLQGNLEILRRTNCGLLGAQFLLYQPGAVLMTHSDPLVTTSVRLQGDAGFTHVYDNQGSTTKIANEVGKAIGIPSGVLHSVSVPRDAVMPIISMTLYDQSSIQV